MICKKLISFFLVLSFLAPMIVGAQGFLGPIPLIPTDQIPPIPISDSALRNKDVGITIFGYTVPGFSFDTVSIFFVKLAISAIVDSTVAWINNGFNGNPAFISDPGKYFTNIADGIAGDYIYGSDVSFLCSPLQNNLRTSLQLNYTRETGRLQRSSQCTLSGVANNINDFYNDFSKGGWESWFELTQTSSYNPYEAYIDSRDELNGIIINTVAGKSQKLNWGKGFLSTPGDCVQQIFTGGVATCIKRAPDKTPGTAIEAQLERVIGTGLGQLELADEFDELIGALMGQLVQKTIFGGIGLVTSGSTKPYSTEGDSTSIGGGSPSPEAQASCYASPETIIVGDEVTWTATSILGKDATFLWSGEGLDGATASTVKVRYTNADTIKSASLTVTAPAVIDEDDGSVITPERVVSVGCRNTVRVSLYAPLQVKCQPGNASLTATRGEKVDWVATISGGTAGSTGNFAQFIWSGDENRVDGETRNAWSIYPAIKTVASSTTTVIQPRYYDKTGNKTANLTVVDNDNSVQAVYQQRCDGSIYIYD
jgi:hypothetical protein